MDIACLIQSHKNTYFIPFNTQKRKVCFCFSQNDQPSMPFYIYFQSAARAAQKGRNPQDAIQHLIKVDEALQIFRIFMLSLCSN